jgi:CDP-diacylglycerol pyrophosphatase
MRDKVKKIIDAAGFSSTYESDRLEALVKIVIDECVVAVQNTDTRHAYTTYDKGMIDATIDRSVKAIYEYMEVPSNDRQYPYR